MGRDTIAGLIAGILQKYSGKKEDESKNLERNVNSFVEIALADDDEDTSNSRPVTALRRHPSENNGAGASSRLSHKSWEAFNHQEEMLQASHTAERVINNNNSSESLTLPDSLNEFEGEEYQSPQLYHDSLGDKSQSKSRLIESHHDVDSLQFPVSPAPGHKQSSSSPVDSLIEIPSSKHPINAAEFFDSITSISDKNKQQPVNFGQAKRRIIPYCDNSLSSGTSAFTSQDVSFDSKDSGSPSDNERTRQIPVPSTNTLYPDLTLAIHPIRTPPTPHNIPIHPLSRRYQTSDLATNSPQPQRIENMSSYISDSTKHTQHELYSPPQHTLEKQTEVKSDSVANTAVNNHTKDDPPRPQSIKTTTEKLKWKFLGW